MAREVTSDGDRIAALASAGTWYFALYQKLILTRRGWGSIESILPTGTPRTRTSSPAKIPLLFGKYPTTCIRPIAVSWRRTTASPEVRQIPNRTATPIRRIFIADLLGPAAANPRVARADRSARASGWASTPYPGEPVRADPAAAHRVAEPAAVGDTDTEGHQDCR